MFKVYFTVFHFAMIEVIARTDQYSHLVYGDLELKYYANIISLGDDYLHPSRSISCEFLLNVGYKSIEACLKAANSYLQENNFSNLLKKDCSSVG